MFEILFPSLSFGKIIFLGVAYHTIIDFIGMFSTDGKFNGRTLSFFNWIYSPSNSTKV